MAANFNNCTVFMILMVVNLFFSFWILILRKLHSTNLVNTKNPNKNLDCTAYICEIYLVSFQYSKDFKLTQKF